MGVWINHWVELAIPWLLVFPLYHRYLFSWTDWQRIGFAECIAIWTHSTQCLYDWNDNCDIYLPAMVVAHASDHVGIKRGLSLLVW